MRQFIAQYRLLIAFTFSLGLHFIAFLFCPHFYSHLSSKGEEFIVVSIGSLPAAADGSGSTSCQQKEEGSDLMESSNLVNTTQINEDSEPVLEKAVMEEVKPLPEEEVVQKEIPSKIKQNVMPLVKSKKELKKIVETKKKQLQNVTKKEKNKKPLNKDFINTDKKSQNCLNDDRVSAGQNEMGQSFGSQGNQENQGKGTSVMDITKAKLRKPLPLPQFPRRARELGLQGEITLHLLIGLKGEVKEIKIVDQRGSDLFKEVTLKTINEKWHGLIEPHQKAGKPMEGWVEIRIPFILK